MIIVSLCTIDDSLLYVYVCDESFPLIYYRLFSSWEDIRKETFQVGSQNFCEIKFPKGILLHLSPLECTKVAKTKQNKKPTWVREQCTQELILEGSLFLPKLFGHGTVLSRTRASFGCSHLFVVPSEKRVVIQENHFPFDLVNEVFLLIFLKVNYHYPNTKTLQNVCQSKSKQLLKIIAGWQILTY